MLTPSIILLLVVTTKAQYPPAIDNPPVPEEEPLPPPTSYGVPVTTVRPIEKEDEKKDLLLPPDTKSPLSFTDHYSTDTPLEKIPWEEIIPAPLPPFPKLMFPPLLPIRSLLPLPPTLPPFHTLTLTPPSSPLIRYSTAFHYSQPLLNHHIAAFQPKAEYLPVVPPLPEPPSVVTPEPQPHLPISSTSPEEPITSAPYPPPQKPALTYGPPSL